MREKIIALLLTAFSVSGIRAIPKDSIIYRFPVLISLEYQIKLTGK
jgi:hypothetical protein